MGRRSELADDSSKYAGKLTFKDALEDLLYSGDETRNNHANAGSFDRAVTSGTMPNAYNKLKAGGLTDEEIRLGAGEHAEQIDALHTSATLSRYDDSDPDRQAAARDRAAKVMKAFEEKTSNTVIEINGTKRKIEGSVGMDMLYVEYGKEQIKQGANPTISK